MKKLFSVLLFVLAVVAFSPTKAYSLPDDPAPQAQVLSENHPQVLQVAYTQVATLTVDVPIHTGTRFGLQHLATIGYPVTVMKVQPLYSPHFMGLSRFVSLQARGDYNHKLFSTLARKWRCNYIS